MPKWAMLLLSILMFVISLLISILIYDSVLSLFQMRDVIVFSGPVAICAIGLPTVLYALGGCVYFFIFNKLPRYNQIIVKYLSYLLFVGIFSGVPIAFAVNYYLKDEGYLTCDRISWMSPTTYVKNISLCD